RRGLHRARNAGGDRRRIARGSGVSAPRRAEACGHGGPAAPPEADPVADAGPRRILGLALPTLGVLVAEPLYLLFDLAVVGRLGALALAGLAVGGLILAQVSSQLTFLAYGT